jgi:hypothetical protein
MSWHPNHHQTRSLFVKALSYNCHMWVWLHAIRAAQTHQYHHRQMAIVSLYIEHIFSV